MGTFFADIERQGLSRRPYGFIPGLLHWCLVHSSIPTARLQGLDTVHKHQGCSQHDWFRFIFVAQFSKPERLWSMVRRGRKMGFNCGRDQGNGKKSRGCCYHRSSYRREGNALVAGRCFGMHEIGTSPL